MTLEPLMINTIWKAKPVVMRVRIIQEEPAAILHVITRGNAISRGDATNIQQSIIQEEQRSATPWKIIGLDIFASSGRKSVTVVASVNSYILNHRSSGKSMN